MEGDAKAPPSMLVVMAALLNSVVSFLVFSFVDVLDVVLCVVYKLADYAVEAKWNPCYCSSGKDAISPPDKSGVPKVVRLCSAKLQLEDVSETLYRRPSRVGEFVRRVVGATMPSRYPAEAAFRVKSNVVDMVGRTQPQPVARWSDCGCKTCDSWSRPLMPYSSHGSDLYVHVEEPTDGRKPTSDVIFIHGFISSSAFWTETVFREFTEATRSTYRLFAVDLLGFGRSPKPADSLYTLREHVEMIEKSVLRRYNVESFHVVAHSLGSVLALALAVKHPEAVKSLTLLAPPFFPVPEGEVDAPQYVMRQVAPRKVWPPIAFGGSMACWYEHVSRTICLLICKHHRLWDFLFRIITLNRMRTFLIDGFMCHTHRAAWHTMHNVICGSADKMEGYLDTVRDRLSCPVAVFHGGDDELLPAECSRAVGSKIPRARVKVFDEKDHVTVVVGQPRAFARELEQIWRNG